MPRTPGSSAALTAPRLRAAAMRLFARHGYAAVSMRRIAGELGLQAGALYRYTPDKQALLFELMRDHMTEVLQGWAAVPRGPEPVAQLADFVRFHIGFHIDRPEAVFVANMELRNLSPGNFAEIERMRRAYEGELEAILAEGQAAGLFDIPDLRLATLAVIAMLTGVTGWYREGGRLSRAAVAETYVDMVLRAVAAPGATPARRAAQAARVGIGGCKPSGSGQT